MVGQLDVDISALEGWLYKEKSKTMWGSIGGDSNKRWFQVVQLEPGEAAAGERELALCYSHSPDDKDFKGWVYLKDVSEISEIGSDFMIISSPARTLRLAAQTRAEHRLWITALCRLCVGAFVKLETTQLPPAALAPASPAAVTAAPSPVSLSPVAEAKTIASPHLRGASPARPQEPAMAKETDRNGGGALPKQRLSRQQSDDAKPDNTTNGYNGGNPTTPVRSSRASACDSSAWRRDSERSGAEHRSNRRARDNGADGDAQSDPRYSHHGDTDHHAGSSRSRRAGGESPCCDDTGSRRGSDGSRRGDRHGADYHDLDYRNGDRRKGSDDRQYQNERAGSRGSGSRHPTRKSGDIGSSNQHRTSMRREDVRKSDGATEENRRANDQQGDPGARADRSADRRDESSVSSRSSKGGSHRNRPASGLRRELDLADTVTPSDAKAIHEPAIPSKQGTALASDAQPKSAVAGAVQGHRRSSSAKLEIDDSHSMPAAAVAAVEMCRDADVPVVTIGAGVSNCDFSATARLHAAISAGYNVPLPHTPSPREFLSESRDSTGGGDSRRSSDSGPGGGMAAAAAAAAVLENAEGIVTPKAARRTAASLDWGERDDKGPAGGMQNSPRRSIEQLLSPQTAGPVLLLSDSSDDEVREVAKHKRRGSTSKLQQQAAAKSAEKTGVAAPTPTAEAKESPSSSGRPRTKGNKAPPPPCGAPPPGMAGARRAERGAGRQHKDEPQEAGNSDTSKKRRSSQTRKGPTVAEEPGWLHDDFDS
eukprot:TRINITY_DN7535_c0_g1_i1.p1 TRINITY_DN7535_c0_g1~~TRINITY_DN7535_c0_g1_i1.p1  ORF type:complete len:765 (-),score=132.23 TRINITY_DN7535_c0_g1_i1:198-2492(-)